MSPSSSGSKSAVLASAPHGTGTRALTSPVMAFAVGGSFVVGTESGDWLSLAGDQLAPIASTGRASAAVRDAAGVLTVACWEPKLERYERGAWSSIALAAPAIALAAT